MHAEKLKLNSRRDEIENTHMKMYFSHRITLNGNVWLMLMDHRIYYRWF